jgi:hypothetical protein
MQEIVVTRKSRGADKADHCGFTDHCGLGQVFNGHENHFLGLFLTYSTVKSSYIVSCFGFSGQYPVCSIVGAVEEFQIRVHVRSCLWSKDKAKELL